jgi:hypothetical protein
MVQEWQILTVDLHGLPIEVSFGCKVPNARCDGTRIMHTN